MPPKETPVVAKPFRYRSIKAIQKQKILEQRREELEIEHFSLVAHLETVESLPPLEDETLQAQRVESLASTRDRVAMIESMVEDYNKRLLDVREEAEEEDKKDKDKEK